MTLFEMIDAVAHRLTAALVSYGHGTSNAQDESAWLVLWCLGLPLDTNLDTKQEADLDSTAPAGNRPLTDADIAQIDALVAKRISTRLPAAYLTQQAWLQGYAFYVDERVIVPRSLIAELLVQGGLDYWLHETTHRVLDLCTGNGSLAVIAASEFPDTVVTAADLSPDALAVARINVDQHGLGHRIALVASDGLNATELAAAGPFDLIICNPPYVNAHSMAELPPEYLAEPDMALNGNTHGGTDGMDFIRALLREAAPHMTPQAVLVLEIGNERAYFEAAFPTLDAVWLETSAGEDQVLLLTHESLIR
jgi:ribosomal protein L3 glutamine methyltransferase